MGGHYFSLHQSSAHPWSFEERDSPRRVEVAPRVGSDDLGPLWESRGGSVRHKREGALPAVLLPIPLPAGRGRSDIALDSSQAVCVPSDQGWRSFGDTHRPELAEPALVHGPDRAAGGTALADPHQEGPAISSERLSVAPESGVVEPSCMAASGISEELSALHSRVLDMLMEVWAPATRRLYALKWGNGAVMSISTRLLARCRMFCIFCSTDWIVDLYHQHWKSMWQLLPHFVPRWAGNRSVGTCWWWVLGFRRLHPPHSVPPWDLEVVLRALSQPPFEPLISIDLKELSIKTALLLALASAKRIGDLHAFSLDNDCIRFGPGDCSVTLRLRPGYVPKSLSTPTLKIEQNRCNDSTVRGCTEITLLMQQKHNMIMVALVNQTQITEVC